MLFLSSNYLSVIIPIAFVLFFLSIIFLKYFFSTKQKIIRKLTKLQKKSIHQLKTKEFSRISGKALHIKEPLIAPLSKRKCIFYKFKIEQKRSNGKNSYWDTIVDKEEFQDFFIKQNDEYVIVRPKKFPKNYMSYLVSDKNAKSGTFNDPTPELENLLNQFNIKSTSLFGLNKNLQYSEGVIEIGEEITAAGVVKWKSLREPIEGYSYSKIVELESSEKEKLIITDLPNIKSKERF